LVSTQIPGFTFSLKAKWNECLREKLVAYWSGRRYRFCDEHDLPLIATRGSVWGNLISFDMSRIRATVRIEPVNIEEVLLTTTVDGQFQTITEWNRAYFQFELAACGSFVSSGDLHIADWSEFLKEHRKAGIQWAFSLGRIGNRIPEESCWWRIRESLNE